MQRQQLYFNEMNYKKIRQQFHSWRCTFKFLAGITILLYSGACKKSEPGNEPINPDQQQIISNLDSIYLYAKQIYLWNEQLPEYDKFNPERFYNTEANGLTAYKNEIFAFTRFALNPATGKAYELNAKDPLSPRYSTIIESNTSTIQGNKNEVLQLRDANPFGLSFYQNDIAVRILYVDLNSPAGKSGLKRGDRITGINDQGIAAPSDFIGLWKDAIKNSFVKLTVTDITGESRQVRLTGTFYEQNPVLKHIILNSTNKKIGFIAYNSFTDESNSSRFLGPVFTEFEQKGISELIIDLRYNGGGYQNSAVYFANQICPPKAKGAVMFTEHYNRMMQQGKAEILSRQLLRDSNNEPFYIDGRLATLYDIDYSEGASTVNFDTNNGLSHINKIYFIVSEQTASASELLINVLKPYADVKLIGVSASGQQQVRTYGKPVGFFNIDIDRYELYVAMYQNKNADAEGDYFEGFVADYSTLDDPAHDFGSLDDPAIQIALGSFAGTSGAAKTQRIQSASSTVKYIFNTDRLDGSIKVSSDFKFRKDRREP